MTTKGLASKLLKMPEQERALLIEHLGYSSELAQSVIIGEFCDKACPQKRKYGKEYKWSKYCGCYLGETPCKSAQNYEDFYRSFKKEGVIDL